MGRNSSSSPARGLPAQRWHGTARSTEACGPQPRVTRARRRSMHARRWRLHRRGRVPGYALGAAVLDSDGEAVVAAVLTGAWGRRQEQRCSTQTVRRLRASCWATTCGEERGVRQRPARRRTWQRGAAYRTEATTTLG
jgi:hypothetical protein